MDRRRVEARDKWLKFLAKTEKSKAEQGQELVTLTLLNGEESSVDIQVVDLSYLTLRDSGCFFRELGVLCFVTRCSYEERRGEQDRIERAQRPRDRQDVPEPVGG